MLEHFRLLAGFNRWANGRIYDAVAALDGAEYHKARDCAFFGSIHGTLNHLLLVDLLWFGRIAGSVPAFSSLDEILYQDLAGLRTARDAEDQRIIELLRDMDEADLDRVCRFTLLSQPGERSMVTQLMLATVFNHQTHHRGQVHAMLKEAGAEPPALDIVLYPEAVG